tara:strand:- start:353 stop:535 length:183 start_codon:yes stop_codon:yes gene_type:complete
MKRSFKNFLILTSAISIGATSIIIWIESLYGLADLFLGAACCVVATGMLLSTKQIINLLK